VFQILPLLTTEVVKASIEAGIFNLARIEDIGALLAVSLNEEILPLVAGNQMKSDMTVAAVQTAFSEAYKWVDYVLIPFGMVAVIAACFLQDMSPYMARIPCFISMCFGSVLISCSRVIMLLSSIVGHIILMKYILRGRCEIIVRLIGGPEALSYPSS
jgi:hypothetical protein